MKKLRGFVQVLTRDELPTTSRDKKEIWLPILKRRWIIEEPRSPIPWLKLIIVRVLRFPQTIEMEEFFPPNDITIISEHPNHYARDDDALTMPEQDASKKKFP